MIRRPPRSTLFPTRRSSDLEVSSVARTCVLDRGPEFRDCVGSVQQPEEFPYSRSGGPVEAEGERSEEHTSELQSLAYLVCRLLLEKKKITRDAFHTITLYHS